MLTTTTPYTHIRVAHPPSGSSNRDPEPGTGDGGSTSTSSVAAFVTRADHTSSSWMAALRARRHHGRRLRPRRTRNGLGGCEGAVAGAVLAKTLGGGDAGGVQTRERHGPISIQYVCVSYTILLVHRDGRTGLTQYVCERYPHLASGVHTRERHEPIVYDMFFFA